MRASGVLLLALAACGAEPTPPPPALVIGPEGVGGLTGPAPLTVSHLQGAFPQRSVIAGEEQLEGQRFRKIVVRDASGAVLIELLPGPDGATLALARTRHPDVTSPAGEAVGRATLADAPATEIVHCEPDLVEARPARACAASANARFWRVYAAGEAPPGPDTELADTAADLPLIEMRWRADR